MDPQPFETELVLSADGPLIRMVLDAQHRPHGAKAAIVVAAPIERVWTVIRDVARFPERIPMIHRVHVNGDRVHMDLRFKVSVFSAGFGFVADMQRVEGRSLVLQWVSGEPRGIRLEFDLRAAPDAQRTLVFASIQFEIDSLGWLVKYFLKHHPEIELGVFPGSLLTLLDAVRRSAERLA